MVLFNLIKKSFQTVINNPSIAMFLVLFLILSNLMTSYVATSHSKQIVLILLGCLFVLICAFIAGWFEVVKESSNEEKIKEKNYFSIFLEGVGNNIVSVIIGIIIYFALFLVAIFLSKLISMKLFGSLDFLTNDIYTLTQSNKTLTDYINTLTTDQQYALYGLQITFISIMAIFNFLTLFYFPAIIYNKNNMFKRPLFAVKDAFIFTFKNFLEVFLLFIIIQGLHLILAILNAVFMSNNIMFILLLFCYIYFASTVVMLIFNYYEQKNNCTNRADCIGEDQPCNQISEKD